QYGPDLDDRFAQCCARTLVGQKRPAVESLHGKEIGASRNVGTAVLGHGITYYVSETVCKRRRELRNKDGAHSAPYLDVLTSGIHWRSGDRPVTPYDRFRMNSCCIRFSHSTSFFSSSSMEYLSSRYSFLNFCSSEPRSVRGDQRPPFIISCCPSLE